MGEFDVCWSTVIADPDTHSAFGEAPDNGWVQQCRLGLGHPGIHASDAGATPRDRVRLWLQWSDADVAHRLTDLEPCPVTDGPDLACVFFAGHGGPHHFAPTSSVPHFGEQYRPEHAASRNGSTAASAIAAVPSVAVPSEQPVVTEAVVTETVPDDTVVIEAPAGVARRSRHVSEPGHAAGESAATAEVRSVDAVLHDLVAILAELATVIQVRRES